VVAISPDLPVWHPELATALLGDLRAGCPLSLAPVFDGGLYLLTLADASAQIAGALTGLDLAGPHGMSGLMALAARAGTEVGLLRAERALGRERDVRALRGGSAHRSGAAGAAGRLGGRDLNPSFRDQNPAS
jgi:glycosyltransferase A (GT-A) superfamily protein (DUF2064 family)